jgi:uncharacterized protein YuzE
MKIRYFPETDTIYMELTDRKVAETVDLNENTLVDLDEKGNVVAITLEHASESTVVDEFSFQRVTSTASEKVTAV